jgi:predicted nucleotidyltransferase
MDDLTRARRWAADFANRFPEVTEAYLVRSRVSGQAAPDSDYDVVLLIQDAGALSLSNFDTTPEGEKAWGWLLPDDADELRFAPDARWDVMLVDASAVGFELDEPHALLFRRQEGER